MIQNLTVDLFPAMAATVSANNNLSRCLFGAGAAAVIGPMLNGMGWGWCYAFVGLLCAATLPIIWWEMKRGPFWREQRRLRDEERKRKERSEQDTVTNEASREKL
jgi:MFS family permease